MHTEIAQQHPNSLLTTRSDYLKQIDRQGRTILHIALQKRQFATVYSILNSNPDFPVDIRDSGGNTLLIVSCRWDNTEMVEYLLSKGADPKIRNFQSKHALAVASSFGNPAVVQTLLNHCTYDLLSEENENIFEIAAGSATIKVLEDAKKKQQNT